MSAFICNADHIAVLAAFYGHYRTKQSGGSPMDVAHVAAAELYTANVASVRFRYPDYKWDELPGPAPLPIAVMVTNGHMQAAVGVPANTVFGEERGLPGLPLVQIIKLAHCLNYQSCEHPGWEASKAHEIVESIISAAVHNLAGYEEAPWEYGGPKMLPVVREA